MVDDETGEEYSGTMTEKQFKSEQLKDFFRQSGYDMRKIEEYGELEYSRGSDSMLE